MSIPSNEVHAKGPSMEVRVSVIYFDNALVVGWDKPDTEIGLENWTKALDDRSLLFHDVVDPCRTIVFVGVELRLGKYREIRNTSDRTWRLYRALRHMLAMGRSTTKIMETILGHVVFFFMVRPCALASLCYCYDFVVRTDNSMRRLPQRVCKELRSDPRKTVQTER